MANTLLLKAFDMGYITNEQREKAEKYKRETGVNDETAVREMKLMSEDMILDVYVMIYRYPREQEPEITEDNFTKQFTYKQLTRYQDWDLRQKNQK